MSLAELFPPSHLGGLTASHSGSHAGSHTSGRLPKLAAASVAAPAGAGALLIALTHMLDEVDYGMVLVTKHGALRHANQLALRSLQGPAPIRSENGLVFAPREADQLLLQQALGDAARGLRRLLTLGSDSHSVTIAVIPLGAEGAAMAAAGEAPGHGPMVMLVFGKQPTSETLTLDFYARAQRLTAAEATVLQLLCAGHRPKEIASQVGVAISTVRTQIGSIRVKTQTRSIRDLTNKVASLPPITPAMKASVCH